MRLVRDGRHTFYVRLGFMLLAAAALIVGCPELAGAQETARPQAPAPRTIILPPKVVAGAPATLAVIDSAGRLLPGVAVEISGQQTGAGTAGNPPQKVTTDSTGRALFLAPGIAGPLIAKIPGRGITAASIGVTQKETPAPGSSEAAPSVLRVTSYPHVLAIHDRFAIAGENFNGAANSDRVFLGDRACLVVAASPVSLVALPGPQIPMGANTLRVSVGGHDAGPFPVTGVLLDFSGPAEAPTAGLDGKLILHVHGTTEPLSVEVRNVSPVVIQLLRGNVQRVGTSGGEQNIAPIEMKFLASGNYVVTARLVPADSASPQGN